VNEKILSEIGENNSSGFQSTMSGNCLRVPACKNQTNS